MKYIDKSFFITYYPRIYISVNLTQIENSDNFFYNSNMNNIKMADIESLKSLSISKSSYLTNSSFL